MKTEGKMKTVCAEEQKLIEEVNNLPGLLRVEAHCYRKMIYINIVPLNFLRT